MSWKITAITIVSFIIMILRIISGYGLYRLRTWGRNLVIGVLSLEFVIRVADFINAWTYSYRPTEARKLLEQIESARALGQDIDIQYVSMIPSYIIAVICLISVIILFKIDFEQIEKKSITNPCS
jgi:hypothetical protein